MKTMQAGDLTVRVAGGEDREGGGGGPLVVLLHGYGAPGTDLVPLWRELSVPRAFRFAFPEAPLALPFGGRAWWHIDLAALEAALHSGDARSFGDTMPDGAAQARAAVERCLDELEATLSPSHLVVGGFSQGAMLSCDLALRSDRSLAGLALMSGTLLAEPEWAERMPARRGLPVLLSHGRADPLLPFARAERLRDLLGAAGLPVRWVPFHGGHGIGGSVLEELATFLTACAPEGGH